MGEEMARPLPVLPKPEFETFEMFGLTWPVTKAKKEQQNNYPKKYIEHAPDMERAISFVPLPERKVALQAGGHCGAWALYLSQQFEQVYTFEPEAANFHCLTRNAARENIFAARGMLGDVIGTQGFFISNKWIGAHHAMPNTPGPIPVYRIDDLGLPRLDLLVLDIEGMEFNAMRGGEKTIAKFKPPIMMEDRRLLERYGFGTWDDMVAWLGRLGYREAVRVAFDVVFVASK